MTYNDPLTELANATHQPQRRRSSTQRATPDNPLGRGFIMACGAAPVILAVIMLANWLSYEMGKAMAKRDIEQASQEAVEKIEQARQMMQHK